MTSGKEKEPQKVTRRAFVKTAMAGTVTTLLAAACAQGQPTTPVATTPPTGVATPTSSGGATTWDRETDVLVVRSGTGLAAAIVAKDAGADVLVLEKASFIGGTTGHSGGALWVPNKYLMREAGIADSKEEALTYLLWVARGQSTWVWPWARTCAT